MVLLESWHGRQHSRSPLPRHVLPTLHDSPFFSFFYHNSFGDGFVSVGPSPPCTVFHAEGLAQTVTYSSPPAPYHNNGCGKMVTLPRYDFISYFIAAVFPAALISRAIRIKCVYCIGLTLRGRTRIQHVSIAGNLGVNRPNFCHRSHTPRNIKIG